MTRKMNDSRKRRAQDYIIFALDVPGPQAADPYLVSLRGRVGMFKIGLELFVRGGPAIVAHVRSKSGAPVFLDLKLHDIPETVRRTTAGMAELGVAFATVHCSGGRRMLEAAVAGAAGQVGILGVTVLTSRPAGRPGGSAPPAADITAEVVRRARMAMASGCVGVICSGLEAAAVRKAADGDFKIVTPGIRPAEAAVRDDQRRIVTPAAAVAAGADYVVIGRPIRDAADPAAAAGAIACQIRGALGQEPKPA